MFGGFFKPALDFILIFTAHCSLLTLRNSREPFSVRLRAFVNRKKGHRNVKNVALNRPQRGHLFIVQGGARPSSTSAGAFTSDKLSVSPHCTCLQMATEPPPQVLLIWGLQINFRKQVNSQRVCERR